MLQIIIIMFQNVKTECKCALMILSEPVTNRIPQSKKNWCKDLWFCIGREVSDALMYPEHLKTDWSLSILRANWMILFLDVNQPMAVGTYERTNRASAS
jgi:hypothetical protein